MFPNFTMYSFCSEYGVDDLYILFFNYHFSNLSPFSFVSILLALLWPSIERHETLSLLLVEIEAFKSPNVIPTYSLECDRVLHSLCLGLYRGHS